MNPALTQDESSPYTRIFGLQLLIISKIVKIAPAAHFRKWGQKMGPGPIIQAP